jgi:K+-transporting ATPase ATPase C chain
MKELIAALRMFLWMTILTGIAYPLIVTGIAQLTMKHKADGSMVDVDGKIVGSALIGQKFTSDRYFWGRPSSVDYNPLPSGGSNLGPTSEALKKAVEERRAAVVKAQEGVDPAAVPSELLYASGSGLDPHISPATAKYQIPRIMKARNLKDEKDIIRLIDELTEKSIVGHTSVNVLLLNVALDQLK